MSHRKKNLVVLICDQQQRNVLDIYGGPVATRAWRRLADNGAAFDRSYCATPLCVPTRPSMMTGLWPHAHGSISFGKESDTKGYCFMNAGTELLIDRLQDNGYRVGHSGIWHINRLPRDDRSKGYDLFRDIQFPYSQYEQARIDQGLDKVRHKAHVETPGDNGVQKWSFSVPIPARWPGKLEEHPDMTIVRSVTDFIQDGTSGKPFAVWCSIGAPHPPLLIPEPWFSMYKAEDMARPPGFGGSSDNMPRTATEYAPGWQAVRDWDWDMWSKAIAGYHGYTAFADHCMGLVLDALSNSGVMENTIVVGVVDHGEMLGSHNLYQKGVLFDRACRVPLVISAPGVAPGARRQFASHVDLAPTLLDMMGFPPFETAQGVSLRPILEDPSLPGREHQFVEFNGYINGGIQSRAVVSDRYKYMYHHNDRDMLFDLEKDPDELRNVIDEPGLEDVRTNLRDALAAWMRETGDFVSMTSSTRK